MDYKPIAFCCSFSATATATTTRTAKKRYFYISKTTILHVHHAFLYISLLSLHDYNVKVPNFFPNFTFCRGREHKTTTICFLFLNVNTGRQKEEDGKTFACDKRDRAITCVFCRGLHLTFFLMVFYKDVLQ